MRILADLRLDRLDENAPDSKGLTEAQVFTQKGDSSAELRDALHDLLKLTTAHRKEDGSDKEDEFYDATE